MCNYKLTVTLEKSVDVVDGGGWVTGMTWRKAVILEAGERHLPSRRRHRRLKRKTSGLHIGSDAREHTEQEKQEQEKCATTS